MMEKYGGKNRTLDMVIKARVSFGKYLVQNVWGIQEEIRSNEGNLILEFKGRD